MWESPSDSDFVMHLELGHRLDVMEDLLRLLDRVIDVAFILVRISLVVTIDGAVEMDRLGSEQD